MRSIHGNESEFRNGGPSGDPAFNMLSHLETASRSSWKRFLAFRSEYDIAGGNLSVCEGPAGCYPDEANLDFTIHLITKGDCWMETRTGDFRQRVQIFPGALTVTPPETRRDY